MKKKTKNNNKTINIFISIAIVALIASLVLMLNKHKFADDKIISINYDEYSELIKRDEYSIILITSPTCTHCNNYRPYANYVANDYDLTVYELSISDFTYEQYIEIHDKYTALKDRYKDDIPVIVTPTTIIAKNNDEIASKTENLGYSGLVNFLKENNIIK